MRSSFSGKINRCRGWLFLIAVISAVLIVSCGDSPVSPIKRQPVGPKLSIPDSTFDFGYAPNASTVSHTFWLHSTGDDTLRITRINPG